MRLQQVGIKRCAGCLFHRLLERMNKDELRAAGHEIGHVANGDMVTLH